MNWSSHDALQLLDQQLHQLAEQCEAARRIVSDLARKSSSALTSRVTSNAPVVDVERREVRWGERSCFLGDTRGFQVLAVLCRYPGRFVSRDELAAEIWTDYDAETSTIHSTVSQLKKKLRAAGMNSLADAIKGERRGYRLDLDHVV